jgi:hypothetical protein
MPGVSRAALVFAATSIILLAGASIAWAETWIGPVRGVEGWRTQGVTLFDPSPPDSFVVDLGQDKGTDPNPQANVIAFSSYAAFTTRSDIPAGLWVEYDIEAWSVTPEVEYTHPVQYMKKFLALARARGLHVILAPQGIGILWHIMAICPRLDGEGARHWWRRCGLASVPADVLLLQAQGLTCFPKAFAANARRTRAVMPAETRLVVEMSVLGDHPCVTPDVIVRSYETAKPYVDGFALGGFSDEHSQTVGGQALLAIQSSQAA